MLQVANCWSVVGAEECWAPCSVPVLKGCLTLGDLAAFRH